MSELYNVTVDDIVYAGDMSNSFKIMQSGKKQELKIIPY